MAWILFPTIACEREAKQLLCSLFHSVVLCAKVLSMAATFQHLVFLYLSVRVRMTASVQCVYEIKKGDSKGKTFLVLTTSHATLLQTYTQKAENDRAGSRLHSF